MAIAALGVSAISQLYQSLQGQGTSQTSTTATDPPPPSPANASSSTGAQGGFAKLSSDLNALLLSLQAANGSSSNPTAAGSTASSTGTAASTDPNATLQANLQNVLGDLQKAGGADRHHHHHGTGQPGNDASTATGTATAGGNSYSQLGQALSAYALQNFGSAAATPRLTA